MKPIERPRSITGEVAGRIRQAIISGDLALGEDLSERQLAEKLGVSKTPVREALAQLRLEGLVRASPPRGVSVFTLSAEEVREMCELRQALEVAAMRLAMARNPESLIAALGEVIDQMTAALANGDVKAYLAADTLFHLRFLENCGNSHLLETYKMHVGKIAALRTHLAQKPQHTDLSYREHRLMVEKLAAGDVAGSLAILDQHIDRTKKTYSSTIEDIAAADRMGAGGN
jgi:DNA-binding GntR family transcriptional regulator